MWLLWHWHEMVFFFWSKWEQISAKWSKGFTNIEHKTRVCKYLPSPGQYVVDAPLASHSLESVWISFCQLSCNCSPFFFTELFQLCQVALGIVSEQPFFKSRHKFTIGLWLTLPLQDISILSSGHSWVLLKL